MAVGGGELFFKKNYGLIITRESLFVNTFWHKLICFSVLTKDAWKYLCIIFVDLKKILKNRIFLKKPSEKIVCFYVDKRRTMGYDGSKQEFPVEHVIYF